MIIDANNQPAPWAIIMAAGKGTRMGGDQPKVLYEVAGRPMVRWVVDACRQAGCQTCVVIVGYQGEKVRAALADDPSVQFVEQNEQLGTGHAVAQARPVMENLPPRDVFVLAGDGPLIRSRTLGRLLEAHRRRKASATLATSLIDDPTGYGRIVRTASGDFDAIVEQKDATPEQLEINEVNPSYYCFRSDELFRALDEVSNDNASGEYYVTDVPAILKQQGKAVAVIEAVPPEDVLSINNPQQLAEVDVILRNRK